MAMYAVAYLRIYCFFVSLPKIGYTSAKCSSKLVFLHSVCTIFVIKIFNNPYCHANEICCKKLSRV